MKLNGNLTLNAGGQSEVQNAVIERLASAPSVDSQERGRLYFNTTDNTYYYNNGTVWVALATGGNAAALQTEVDAIETSLGSMVNTSGVFTATPFSTTQYLSAVGSVTAALVALDSALGAHNTLAELDDVLLTTPTNGQALVFNSTSGKWEDTTLTLSNLPSITASASEINQLTSAGALNADFVKLAAITASAANLNILSGTTTSATEINYLTGVTSAIQTQLNNKQPLDAQLTSLAGLSPVLNDVVFGDTVAGTFVLDTGSGARSRLGLVIGTNVQAYDPDLAQIAAFAPADSEFMVGTGGGDGARWTLESGATVRTSLGLGDIATLDASAFIRTNGTSTVTANIPMATFKITGMGTPTASNDATTKAYVDSLVAAGATWRNPVVDVDVNAVVSAVPGSPVNGATYIAYGGSYPQNWGTGAAAVVSGDIVARLEDGSGWVVIKNLAAGDRLLFAVEHGTLSATLSTNGFYSGDLAQYVAGDPALTASWTFPEGRGGPGAPEIVQGITVLCATTTSQHYGHTYLYNATGNAWVEIAGPGSIGAGDGLFYSGNVLNVNMGAGIVALPSDEVGIDLYDAATSAIILTSSGTDRVSTTAGKLHLLLDLAGNGKLVQSANGLKVTTNTITENELTASVAGNGLTGGNGTALAVVSAAGTASTVGTLVITANDVGVALGSTSTTAAPGNHVHAASAVTFTPVGTISSTDTQAAVAEVSGDVTSLTTTVGNLQTEVDAIETGVGLNTDGTLTAFSATNYINGLTIRAAAVALDTATKSLDTQINNRVTALYYLYTGASATSHVVTHSLGQKYCNVTVVDVTDNVVIPQSIVFDSTTQLTVTFNATIACKVVVMGAVAYP